MANPTSVAIRKAQAQERIDAACTALAEMMAVAQPDWERSAGYRKYPDVQAAVHLEVIADFLEPLVVSLTPEPEPEPEEPPPPPDPKDKGKK